MQVIDIIMRYEKRIYEYCKMISAEPHDYGMININGR